MNSPKKCPYTTLTQSKLGKTVGDFMEQIIKQINTLTGNKPLTFQYANKYLGLENNKKEFDSKYANLSIKQISENLDNSKESDQYVYTMISIENEISTYIFHSMMLEVKKMHANNIDFSKYNDVKDHFFSIRAELIENLTKIADNVLQELYNNVKDIQHESRIYQITKVYLQKNEKTEISNRLKQLLYDDGIENTIYAVFEGVYHFIDRNDTSDRTEIEKFIQNDEGFWSQIGLLNKVAMYLQKGTKPGFIYSKSQNKTIINVTEREFEKIVKKNYNTMPPWVQRKTYKGCPLMYTKIEINGKQMNGILGYQKILYSLILDRIEGYKAYNRQKNNQKKD